MSDPNRGLIEAWYHRMWNRWDKSAIAEICDAGIVFRGSLGQEKRGHAGIAEYMDFVRAAFPDFTNTIEEVIAEGDRAFARLTYAGTHAGEIFGVAPTGRRVTYAGAAVFRFAMSSTGSGVGRGADAGGDPSGPRICQVWVLGDVHGLLHQLRGDGAP